MVGKCAFSLCRSTREVNVMDEWSLVCPWSLLKVGRVNLKGSLAEGAYKWVEDFFLNFTKGSAHWSQ